MRRRLTTLLLLMLLLLWAITELQLQLPELETNSHFSGRLDSSSSKNPHILRFAEIYEV